METIKDYSIDVAVELWNGAHLNNVDSSIESNDAFVNWRNRVETIISIFLNIYWDVRIYTYDSNIKL